MNKGLIWVAVIAAFILLLRSQSEFIVNVKTVFADNILIFMIIAIGVLLINLRWRS